MNENHFVFEDVPYRAEAVKPNVRNKCNKCVFKEKRECGFWRDIPYCSAECRDDGRSVVFVKATTNFDRIAESPEALAKQMVYSAFDEFDGEEWFGITGNKIRESFKNKEEAVTATVKWLNEEVEE